MDPVTVSLLTLAATVVAVLAGAALFVEMFGRNQNRIRERVAQQFSGGPQGEAAHSPLFKNLVREGNSRSIFELLRQAAQDLLDDAGLSVPVSRAVVYLGGSAFAMFAAVSTLTTSMMLGAVSIFPVVGIAILGLVVLRHRRQALLLNQLPEAFELMSRAIRAGQTLNGGFQLVAAECRPPLATEFSQCNEQQKLGLPQETTLRELARRVKVMEFQMFVVALQVQRQSGGNPVEMLASLSQTVRRRIRLQARIRTLTSEGRMQAVVLSFLPAVSFFAIQFLSPDYAAVLIERPHLLIGVAVMDLVGMLWIKRIITLNY